MSQAKYSCPICKQQAPDLKSMEQHHESKASTPLSSDCAAKVIPATACQTLCF
jgi:hypothetical protein